MINDIDFEIFYDSMIDKVFVVVAGDEPLIAFIKEEAVPTATSTSASASTSTAPVDHPIAMPAAAERVPASSGSSAPETPAADSSDGLRYSCDNCEEIIIGHRYHCLECNDFDLCLKCESSMVHDNHVMIRLPKSTKYVSTNIYIFMSSLF